MQSTRQRNASCEREVHSLIQLLSFISFLESQAVRLLFDVLKHRLDLGLMVS